MLLNFLVCFIRMPTLSQLALKSPLFMIFCIPFPPSNSKMVNWLNQYNTKSNCRWNIPLHWYFSTRSSKAWAISIRLLNRLFPSCLSWTVLGEQCVFLKDFLIGFDFTNLMAFSTTLKSSWKVMTGLASFFLRKSFSFLFAVGISMTVSRKWERKSYLDTPRRMHVFFHFGIRRRKGLMQNIIKSELFSASCASVGIILIKQTRKLRSMWMNAQPVGFF